MSGRGRVRAGLSAPVDVAPLVCFRILFGVVVLWEVVRYFRYGWIEQFYVRPVFHFTYYGFDWVRPWPGVGMHLHFAALGLLALLIAVGLWYRVATVLFCAAFTYVFLFDEVLYLNHWYLICLLAFLLTFLPAHRALSVDAWRKPALRAGTAPAWTLWVLRAQIALVYFHAGVAKLNGDWLGGAPLGGWLAGRADVRLVGGLLASPWAGAACARASLVLDLALAPLLLWRRTVVPAAGMAIAFHVLNRRLFGLGIFPWLMIGSTVLFLPPGWLRRLVPGRPPGGDAARASPPSRAVVAVLGVHLVVQALVPLRHWLYPGDVSWTEEGHRFGWHMMLREKKADAQIWTVDRRTGRAARIDVGRYLTARQRERMASHPDMILQMSHRIAEDLGPVEVHALVKASLAGRRPQWLIDPRVDLAAEPRSLRHADWIVPLGVTVEAPTWAGARY